MLKKNRFVTYFCVGLLIMAMAQESFGRRSRKVASTPLEEREKDPLMFWYGVNAGFTWTSPADTARDPGASGFSAGLRFDLSGTTPSWWLDFGAGWFYTKLEPDQYQEVVVDGRTRQVADVTARLGFVSLGAYYRMSEKFGIGPYFYLPFGSDATFDTLGIADDSDLIFFGGLQGIYRFSQKLRFGGYATMDLNASETNVFLAGLMVQLGIPLHFRKSESEPEPDEKCEPTIEYKDKTKIRYRDRYLIDGGYIYFTTGKYIIRSSDKKYLRHLGKYLDRNDEKWKKVWIISSTDRRGSVALNKRLSKNRAVAVRKLLAQSGVNTKKMIFKFETTEGEEDRQRTQIQLARNRSVQLIFVGDSKVVRLKRDVSDIRRKYEVPPTCVGRNCK